MNVPCFSAYFILFSRTISRYAPLYLLWSSTVTRTTGGVPRGARFVVEEFPLLLLLDRVAT